MMTSTESTDALIDVLPILHTPFTAEDEIDRESLQKEIDFCFDVGSQGVCSAMVSEILRLTPREREELTVMMVVAARGRGPVVASVGAESTREAVYYGEVAVEAGCAAVMAIPPINCALPEGALWEYYTTLADRIELPLFVQDASSYVGQEIPASFYLRLLESYGPEKILFKPEAAPLGPKLTAFHKLTGNRAKVFDGSGGLLMIDCYRRGLTGTMPGCDMLAGIVALWNALKAGDDRRAYQLYFPICALATLQMQAGLDGFLAIEKYLLHRQGIFETTFRRKPYRWELDEGTREEVDRLWDYLQAAIQA
ncbi:L-2-keto-3-deoxyarabonate dehydratase [Polystyrenella longa]|uniref:L-2-keto-3-deoxyarabonate dehydratase n=1 Tax=Polystyrenella longa TaxID=2528007 RepID=A0A518CL91_9PLAN|nr:dihydrodipicolinate synthase family protein [Polystyrenella longa]QDU79989.1 L-2-keto-3-deoxyarabonate dehydratase [Polystyrenella longa]